MKRFRFQFQAVMNVRKERENAALVALGAAQRAYQQEVAEKQELQRQLTQSLSRRENLGAQATPVLSFQLEQAFINGTKQRLIRADQAIFRASRNVEKALRAYLHARRQTRMIEILEEKARAEHRAVERRREAKALDELVTMRARLMQEMSGAADARSHSDSRGDETSSGQSQTQSQSNAYAGGDLR